MLKGLLTTAMLILPGILIVALNLKYELPLLQDQNFWIAQATCQRLSPISSGFGERGCMWRWCMLSSLYFPPTPRSVLIFYSAQKIRTFWNFVTKELMLIGIGTISIRLNHIIISIDTRLEIIWITVSQRESR